jgi:hypothetical protein
MMTHAQHLWLVKLLGYDYDIEYKQWRENVLADAIFKIPSKEIYALTISTISTNLMGEIKKSYGEILLSKLLLSINNYCLVLILTIPGWMIISTKKKDGCRQ